MSWNFPNNCLRQFQFVGKLIIKSLWVHSLKKGFSSEASLQFLGHFKSQVARKYWKYSWYLLVSGRSTNCILAYCISLSGTWAIGLGTPPWFSSTRNQVVQTPWVGVRVLFLVRHNPAVVMDAKRNHKHSHSSSLTGLYAPWSSNLGAMVFPWDFRDDFKRPVQNCWGGPKEHV